jgi:hypothetical protein
MGVANRARSETFAQELTPCSARSPDRRREGVGDLCPAGDLRDEFFRQEVYTVQIDQPNCLLVKINAADGGVFQGKPIPFSLQ